MEDAERGSDKLPPPDFIPQGERGLPPLKYLLITSYTTKRNSDTPVRIHHHIVMNGGLDAVTWWKSCGGSENAGPERRSNGFCNADRLQADENGIAALCVYLVKQSGGKKRWTSSQNLERPTSQTNDGKYNRRQIESGRGNVRGGSFGKRNIGWTLTDEDYGIEYKYNDFTGWSIYLKLRRKNRKGGQHGNALPGMPELRGAFGRGRTMRLQAVRAGDAPPGQSRGSLCALWRFAAKIDKDTGKLPSIRENGD